MAQHDLFQNHKSRFQDVNAIRTIRFDKNIPSNKSQENNFDRTYLQPTFFESSPNRNPVNHDQPLPVRSHDSITSESDKVSNVLRWLRSLPPNFVIDDLEKNLEYCKLKEKTRHFCRRGGNKSKSLGSSLKSTDGVPLEGKGMMLLANKQKVNFIDKVNSTKMKSPDTKKKLINKKHYTNSSPSRLSNKCCRSDLPSKTKNQQNSINNNQYQRRGILKNTTQKSILPSSQKNTIEKQISNNKRILQISSNKRLLDSIKEIINTSDSNDRIDEVETDKKDNKIKKNKKTVSISNIVEVPENSTKKPFLKNPAIEKELDKAMRSILNKYIRSSTWDDFQKNNNEKSHFKKNKRVIPSLAPVSSFHTDLIFPPIGQQWNTNNLNNLHPF